MAGKIMVINTPIIFAKRCADTATQAKEKNVRNLCLRYEPKSVPLANGLDWKLSASNPIDQIRAASERQPPSKTSAHTNL